MIFIRAFKTLNRSLYILLIPILIDAVALAAGLRVMPFYRVSKPSFIMIYEVGLPSLAHILNKPLLANTLKFLAASQKLSLPVVLTVLTLLVINALGQGAYIGILYKMASGEKAKPADALYYAKRFWFRFFLFAFITILIQMAVVTFFVLFFKVAGTFAAMALCLLLRIGLIYFEYSLVIHDTDFGTACSNAYGYFKQHAVETYLVVPAIFLSAGMMSYLLHRFWSLDTVFLYIAIYSYVMTVLQLALMMSLQKILRDM